MKIGQWTSEWLKAAGHRVHFSKSIASTNGWAKESAMQEDEPATFYLTDHQTAGRGQGDHKWINAEPGTNLLLTCSFGTIRPAQPELCLQLGKELAAACREVWPDLNWRVKAPNDLLLDDEKVAGLLLESISQGDRHRLLLGLGFNVLAQPEDPSFQSTHLQGKLSTPLQQTQWNHFLEELFARIFHSILPP